MVIKANARSLNALGFRIFNSSKRINFKKRGTTEENIKTIKVGDLL